MAVSVKCNEWALSSSKDEDQIQKALLSGTEINCPCNGRQASKDNRYMEITKKQDGRYFTQGYKCFYPVFPATDFGGTRVRGKMFNQSLCNDILGQRQSLKVTYFNRCLSVVSCPSTIEPSLFKYAPKL